MIMSRLGDAVEAGKHVKLIDMLRFSNLTQHEILKELGLLKLNSTQIQSLMTLGLEHGMKEREKLIPLVKHKEVSTFQASFQDLLLSEDCITVGDLHPEMKKTKFKSKYQAL